MDKHGSIEDRLAAVPLFSGLNTKQLGRVASLATYQEVPAGTVLTREGELGREFVVVLEGEIEIRRGDQVVATGGPGTYVGEIALVQRQPRTATVVALTPAVIEVIDAREFSSLLNQFPELAVPLMATIAERLADLEHQSAG